MIKHTEAQTEAMADAIIKAITNEPDAFERVAKAALAAAQVGKQDNSDAAHTHKLLGEMIEWTKKLGREAQNATIERCAQVAENIGDKELHNAFSISITIAAEIRKLKDETILEAGEPNLIG